MAIGCAEGHPIESNIDNLWWGRNPSCSALIQFLDVDLVPNLACPLCFSRINMEPWPFLVRAKIARESVLRSVLQGNFLEVQAVASSAQFLMVRVWLC